MIRAKVEFEKINDETIGEAIIEIPDGASKDQSQSNLEQSILGGTPDAVEHDDHGRSGSKRRQ